MAVITVILVSVSAVAFALSYGFSGYGWTLANKIVLFTFIFFPLISARIIKLILKSATGKKIIVLLILSLLSSAVIIFISGLPLNLQAPFFFNFFEITLAFLSLWLFMFIAFHILLLSKEINTAKLRSAANIRSLIVTAFVLFLFFPLIFQISGISKINKAEFIVSEKRQPFTLNIFDSLKDMKLSSLDDFPGKVERWYNDNFGLRTALIRLYSIFNTSVLGESVSNDRVIIGKNDMLFLGESNNMVISKHRGIPLYSDQEISSWVRTIQDINEICGEKGLDFYFITAPDKHNIYPEYLPSWCIPYSERSNKDVFYDFMRENTDLFTVDLHPLLLDAKEQYGDLLYLKTDAHWSKLGAFLGYQKIISEINMRSGRDLKVLEMTGYEVIDLDEGYYMLSMLGLEKDTFITDFRVDISVDMQPKYFFHTRENGKREIVMPGMSADYNYLEVFENPFSGNDTTILILRDSFTTPLSKFFTYDFAKSVYIHIRDGLPRFSELLDTYSPDLVLFIIGERGLGSEYPGELNIF